jgi:hypothetical protein
MNLRICLFSVLLICSTNLCWSQAYTVSYDTAAYLSLSTFDIVDESNPELDASSNELYNSIPIGFTFEIEGESFDSLMVAESGYVRFRSSGLDRSYISMFECQLEDFNGSPAASPIVYYTEGLPGNQIFKCEFINKGFVNDFEKNDFVHFQLWLYENCNDFEVRIGDPTIEMSELDLFYNNNPAPVIGYGNSQAAIYYELSGVYSLPQLLPAAGNSLSSVPPHGTVYNYTKCTADISETSSIDITIAPNPTEGLIVISGAELSRIDIVNMQGQIIISHLVQGVETLEIDLSKFENGIYLINAYGEDSMETKKIIKQ